MHVVAGLSLRTKALIAPILFLLAFAVLIGLGAYWFYSGVLEQRHGTLRAVSKAAVATLTHFEAAERAGTMTRAEAQKAAAAVIGRLRYGSDDYVSLLSPDATFVMHPNAAFVGLPRKDLPPNVASLVSQLVQFARANDGQLYGYRYPRAAGGEPVLKESYLVRFKPWDWTVSAGLYMDDVENETWSFVRELGGIALAVSLLAFALGWMVMAEFDGALRRVLGCMTRLAEGELDAPVTGQARRDEAGLVARALETFRGKLAAAAAAHQRTAAVQEEADRERARNEAGRAEAAAEQGKVVDCLAAGLSRLADQDLTCMLAESFAPEYERLRADFNAAVTRLQEVVGTVVTSSETIRAGSSQLGQAADDLSRRTEQQAASLEQTAAAMHQLTATVGRTATSAETVRDAVRVARTDAEQSGEVVRQAVEAMSEIERSSNQVGEIIGVIDGIAFQTNLLALNAGVEAARAGDAGRGFAVVASEVRALAQRSADAAKEIKALISKSSHQVSSGVDLVGRTGVSLQRIVVEVTEIDGMVAEIAASAKEQAVGLAEVNTAVNQMDQVTQQNAAMVEESTAASHNLTQEAEELQTLLAGFRLDAASAPSPARHPAAPQPPAGQPAAARSAPRPATRQNARGTRRGTAGSTAQAAAPTAGRTAKRAQAPAEAAWAEF